MLVTVATLADRCSVRTGGARRRYVVLYKQRRRPTSKVGDWIERSGGQLVANYDAIGVAIAKSDIATFAQAFANDARIESVAASTSAVARLSPSVDAVADASPGDLPNAPATDVDPLAPLQWDMRQIHAPEAHAITGGSPAVVVGDIDTGLDKDHPDLVAEHRLRATASRASAVRPSGRRRRGTTTTATARTPPARSRRRRTASASPASRRT